MDTHDTPDNTPEVPDNDPNEEGPKLVPLEEMQDILRSYQEEFQLGESEDIRHKCEALFTNKAEDIAAAMLTDALHCPDDRVRHSAQKYILDNIVFPSKSRGGGREEIADLVKRLQKDENEVTS